jgi:hypothetical protein
MLESSLLNTKTISSINPKLNQAIATVKKSIPNPVNQVVRQSIVQVQQEAPKAKKEIINYAQYFRPTLLHLIFLSYFLAIFLRKALPFSLADLGVINFWIQRAYLFITWIIGGLIGWNLLFLDNLVYIYLSHPESPATAQASLLFKQKGLVEWLKFLLTFKGPQHLALRSFLFQISWLVLALFALTSSNSYLGKGVVIGLGLHLLLENWQMQICFPQILNTRLFWQIKRPVSLEEQKHFLYLFTGLFAILSVLV